MTRYTHARTASAVTALALLLAFSPHAQAASDPDTPTLGADLDGLLDAGRHLNPSLQAAALETAAMDAEASAADALEDPTFRVNSDEVDRTSGPRLNKTYITVEQEFPLWGKRDLRRSVALAAVDAARGRERAVGLELEERIKGAYALYAAASAALAINGDVGHLDRQMARNAADRYAHGLGSQGDALTATAEAARTEVEAARLMADRTAATARLNTLLARPADMPLAPPTGARPLPASNPPLPVLADRAQADNPRLAAGLAEVRGAEEERRLAAKAWYPDLTLGVGAIQRDNGPSGYTATIGFKIPLQAEPKRAKERQAATKANASRQSLAATAADIEGDLAEALAALNAARQQAGIYRAQLLPDLGGAHEAALAAYGRGQGSLAAVLEAEHRLHQARLDLLRIEVEGQKALAALERLVGGPL
ncbi:MULTISPECIES: TolC family protein [Nitrospirillum]|uniref:Outer membrane protein TolC n=1 Tax=Nitrospirillum amazonense TaxID=28077 RepID=A0A560G3J1_9PROT|nr:TolC family protein [Nitrospirillum amazonense]MEC4593974.1 TolC family protein [Nitrospirillum amazonense]TWB28290.1 outer membrane protein TolC [Nitrospirillum amazonense]